MKARQPFLVTYLIVLGVIFVMGTAWNRLFHGDLTLIEMAFLALPMTLFLRGFSSRGGRTPKSVIFLRQCVFTFVFFMVVATLWNWAVGRQFWTPLEMAIAAVVTVAFFGSIAWLGVHGVMMFLFGDDPTYRAMRDSGYDPYFDSVATPFDTDTKMTRKAGLQEPKPDVLEPRSH